MLMRGDFIRKIVDPKETVHADRLLSYGDVKYFDLLGWDPRGVNNTTPGFSCFPSHLNRQAWEAQDEAIGFALDDNKIFSEIWSRKRAHVESCTAYDPLRVGRTAGDKEHLGSYVSTAYVVRDMVEIIERHGEWREKQTVAHLGAFSCSTQKKQRILERTAWRKGDEQLQYWGFSYGFVWPRKYLEPQAYEVCRTFLGQAFASMQPHRVGRLVLDGVVDAPDYAATGWSTNLNDVDEILTNFTLNCYEAGPQLCSFFDEGGPLTIQANLDTLLQKLESAPVPAWTEQGPASISRSDTLMMIFQSIYSPTASFPMIANLLSDLSRGNGTAFAELKAVRYESSCARDGRPVITDTTDASGAIVCSDGDDLTGMSREDYLEYIRFLNRQSPYFGNGWALIKLPCLAYTIRAKWRFAGPFGTETAHPILFASQSLDPVTPFRNAVTAAKLFPKSAVVEATGMGHTTLAMPSVCTAKTIREYFQSGTLPENGKKCPVDVRPFDEGKRHAYEGADRELLDALVEIAKTWPWRS